MVESDEKPVAWRSVSQVNQYRRCPYQYYLQRIEKVWQKPAAWLPQGTAVHASVESYEKSDRTMTLDEAQAVYLDSYVSECNAYLEKVSLVGWFWSGPYSPDEDIPRRRDLGLAQIERYLDFAADNPAPDTLDGVKAVEIPFEIQLGDVPARGFIDQVVKRKPIDVKSGNKPGDEFQLATYAGALEQMYDIKPTQGYYWMGRAGALTTPFDLRDWTQQRLTDEFGEVNEAIESEIFDPDPEQSKCRFCDVRMSCEFSAV